MTTDPTIAPFLKPSHMAPLYNTGLATWQFNQPCDWSENRSVSHWLLGPCPRCGSITKTYGGGYSCCNEACENSASRFVACTADPAPKWWGTDVQVYKDGNAWCAVDGATFQNLQESPAGFGDTPNEAVKNLVEEWRKTTATGTAIAEGMPSQAEIDAIHQAAWDDHQAYIAKGVCSDCGACSAKEAESKCVPRRDCTDEVSCAGEDLWQQPTAAPGLTPRVDATAIIRATYERLEACKGTDGFKDGYARGLEFALIQLAGCDIERELAESRAEANPNLASELVHAEAEIERLRKALAPLLKVAEDAVNRLYDLGESEYPAGNITELTDAVAALGASGDGKEAS